MPTPSAPPPEAGSAPSPATAAEVWTLMRRVVDAFSPRHELRRRLGDGLAKGRTKVKSLLLLGGGALSLGEIAEAQGIDRPYATAIVDQLESLGLVERTADPTDRRRRLVALTPAGERAAGIAADVIATPPAALAALTHAELAQLAALLSRLVPADAAPAGPADAAPADRAPAEEPTD